MKKFRPGVLFSSEVEEVYSYAHKNHFALPAINVVNTHSINGVMEAAKRVNSPVIIQISHGGAAFYAGKSLSNEGQRASVAGAKACAYHVHAMAEFYGVSVILHTDHASQKLLPWIDGLIEASEEYFAVHGRPLFSSHMLDLSKESLEENLYICTLYFKRMIKIGMGIEIELGITGEEKDGINRPQEKISKLYTQPEEVLYAYKKLKKIGNHFTIAASFGNVHGVYRPGNVQLTPSILRDSQNFIKKTLGLQEDPIHFTFHGGSGSKLEEIRESIDYGVVKMNLDTDMQWAFCSGVRDYFIQKEDYLKTQIGNSDGADHPNKKYYDPRRWLRSGEERFVRRCEEAFQSLGNNFSHRT